MRKEKIWVSSGTIFQLAFMATLVPFVKNGLAFIPGWELKTPRYLVEKYASDILPKNLTFFSWSYIFGSQLLANICIYKWSRRQRVFDWKYYMSYIMLTASMFWWMFSYGSERLGMATVATAATTLSACVKLYCAVEKFVEIKSKADLSTGSHVPVSGPTPWIFKVLLLHPTIWAVLWGIETLTIHWSYYFAYELNGIGTVPICGTYSLMFFVACQTLWTLADIRRSQGYFRHLRGFYVFVAFVSAYVVAANYEWQIGLTTNNCLCIGSSLVAVTTFGIGHTKTANAPAGKKHD